MAKRAKAKRKKRQRGRYDYKALKGRLSRAAEGFNFREIGDFTGCHPESVRRYMSNGRVPVHFLAGIAQQFRVSPDWLLLGTGKMRARGKGR